MDDLAFPTVWCGFDAGWLSMEYDDLLHSIDFTMSNLTNYLNSRTLFSALLHLRFTFQTSEVALYERFKYIFDTKHYFCYQLHYHRLIILSSTGFYSHVVWFLQKVTIFFCFFCLFFFLIWIDASLMHFCFFFFILLEHIPLSPLLLFFFTCLRFFCCFFLKSLCLLRAIFLSKWIFNLLLQ